MTTARQIRAALYLRTYAENQRASSENQANAIRRYADISGIDVVRIYKDGMRQSKEPQEPAS